LGSREEARVKTSADRKRKPKKKVGALECSKCQQEDMSPKKETGENIRVSSRERFARHPNSKGPKTKCLERVGERRVTS